jgi:putative transposase
MEIRTQNDGGRRSVAAGDGLMEGGAPSPPETVPTERNPPNELRKDSFDGAEPSMNGKISLPDRGHPAHFPPVERFNTSTLFFVTVCSKDRKPLFCFDDTHTCFQNAWIEAGHFRVGRYVLMPDHIHFFCSPSLRDASLGKWMKYWKTLAARSWPRPEEHPVWQTDFWDTQMRRGESYSEKWLYVRNNPVRAGFVTDAESWPFQGEMNVLRWCG